MMYLIFLFSSLVISDHPTTWIYDIDEAKEVAQQEGKNILMVFSGSDWCAPCKKLKKNILTDDDFVEYQDKNLVILYLDFPSRKKNKLSKDQTKHNEALADKYNSSGNFPLVILLDAKGDKIGGIKYDGQSTEKFIDQIKDSI